MPDKKISEFPDGAPALAADAFPIERGSLANFKLTLQNILNLISGYLFPTLNTTTVGASSTNVGTFTTVVNATIDGILDVTSTATYTGAVTNSGNVNTVGTTTNNDTTLLKGVTTIAGATTYAKAATHSGVNTFNSNINVSSTGSMTIQGKFTASSSNITLATGATVTIGPSVGDNSKNIATTSFVKDSMFANTETYYGFVPEVTYSYGSRALDTVYTNNWGRPIYVAVLFGLIPRSDNFTQYIAIYVDSAATPGVCSTLLCMCGAGPGTDNTNKGQVFGIIPVGRSYKVTSYKSKNYEVWRELR
jgi:hypothetical protein